MSRTLCLIGHRGTGKSQLLRRLKSSDPTIECVDLDSEIESATQMTIPEIFRSRGEAYFRSLEIEMLRKIIHRSSQGLRVVALGAGFQGDIPSPAQAVWLRRETDARGRIFLDRPRLDSKVDPLMEYLARFPQRDDRYTRLADEVLTMREGEELAGGDVRFLLEGFRDVGGIVTLLPGNFRSDIGAFLEKRVRWGVQYIELRDDLLSPTQIRQAKELIPKDRILYSFRKQPTAFEIPADISLWDWDLDSGPVPTAQMSIVSCHTRVGDESLGNFFSRLEKSAKKNAHLKAAPVVKNFAELKEGHVWMCEDPRRRSFLPRSPEGSTLPLWKWYRLLQKGRMPLNFWREGVGSALDQPILLEWVDAPRAPKNFGAVLGNPVAHSRTPLEHRTFFLERKMPCLAVPVSEEDIEAGALELLEEWGLSTASVTAPLKTRVFGDLRLRGVLTPMARALESVNTLQRRKGMWWGHCTDLEGFRKSLDLVDLSGDVAVWGGGGVLPIVRNCLPTASYYTAREGKLSRGPGTAAPNLVVWAGSRATTALPKTWKPRTVLDLNYFEDSPGRAYALAVGAKYVSGLTMFEAQAAAQRRFWEGKE